MSLPLLIQNTLDFYRWRVGVQKVNEEYIEITWVHGNCLYRYAPRTIYHDWRWLPISDLSPYLLRKEYIQSFIKIGLKYDTVIPKNYYLSSGRS